MNDKSLQNVDLKDLSPPAIYYWPFQGGAYVVVY